MNARNPVVEAEWASYPDGFSGFSHGPLDRFWRRVHPGAGLEQLLRFRTGVAASLTWPPLLLLSVAEGHAWGSSVAVPFLHDVQVHARLLVALPLLALAELVVYRRMGLLVGQFFRRGLIPEKGRARFEAALMGAVRLRDSTMVEVLLFALVYAVGVGVIWRTRGALHLASWYGVEIDGVLRPSLAGWWLLCVSLPLFQFLLLRWYFRLFIWARFLWQVSRIELLLEPTDPDRCGGLGFLAGASTMFAPVLLAQGTVLAGTLAHGIFFEGAMLVDSKTALVAVVAIMLCVVLGPLLPFTRQLAAARRFGVRTFGIMAHGSAREFGDRWLRGGAPCGERLLSTNEIQSLADLGRAFDLVKSMRLVPFTATTMAQIAVLTLAPVLPLTLTMLPLEELLALLLKMVF
jgi:hypothetical protein